MPEPEWITSAKAAALLHYHPSTVVRKFCPVLIAGVEWKDNGRKGNARRVWFLLSVVERLSLL